MLVKSLRHVCDITATPEIDRFRNWSYKYFYIIISKSGCFTKVNVCLVLPSAVVLLTYSTPVLLVKNVNKNTFV